MTETTVTIRGVPVRFPFEPYSIQKDYMEKVIDCLQNSVNGILESPTGTGKTLSLLCASLAWLEMKKAEARPFRSDNFLNSIQTELTPEENGEVFSTRSQSKSTPAKGFKATPSIIYSSRTHTQLSQAVQELQRTAYKKMRAHVVGSREQMCIHPEVMKEKTSYAKIYACKSKISSRMCHFYNRVETFKDSVLLGDTNIHDIEDLNKLGQTHRFCPYFMARELRHTADIIFLPYNYLLDAKARKAAGIDLTNNIIILDEAHNVDKVCEESASLQIRSSDISLAIDDITSIMKDLNDNKEFGIRDKELSKDITPEKLCDMKELFLNFEKELDAIEMKTDADGMTCFDGNFIFELLTKIGIRDENANAVIDYTDRLIQCLASAGDNPFVRKGAGLQIFYDLLVTLFTTHSKAYRGKMDKCFKVHISQEEVKFTKQLDGWLSKSTQSTKPSGRVLSYWCFSPGFGMNMLMKQGIRNVILTSGTLAPLQPLITELNINVGAQLENPHIVTAKQMFVRIVNCGPDGVPLNCTFQNRDKPDYLSSLGRTILNLIRHIPGGVLIFFPSYPIMNKAQQFWEANGTWSHISNIKQIYVEPRQKEPFAVAMSLYDEKIRESASVGAIFMSVCRGKVSEGLDFADANGRAVLVTGIPYPPFKDPKIILKKRYLSYCSKFDKEYLKGDEWYNLEAVRAVNQAVGRVIRHRHDFGAIILLDSRFNSSRVKDQMSRWLQDYIRPAQNFGELIRDLKRFFTNTEDLPQPIPKVKPQQSQSSEYPTLVDLTNAHSSNNSGSSSSYSPIPKKKLTSFDEKNALPVLKRKKIALIQNSTGTEKKINIASPPTTIQEIVAMVKESIDKDDFKSFVDALAKYRNDDDVEKLMDRFAHCFCREKQASFILQCLQRFIKSHHQDIFTKFVKTYT